MRFSVVMPSYNRADLIGESLDSILAQDLPPDEVIVVDDGSTDGTPDVVARYGNRVRLIRVENGGDLVARNIGLRAATNPLVAFCDSDDLWEPQFLSAMADLWRREPGLGVAYGNFRIVREGRWSEKAKFQDAPPGYWDELRSIGPEAGMFDTPSIMRLLRFQPFFASAIVVSREAFMARGGWDEGASRIVGTDFATALRMAERPVGVLLRPLVGIRKHASNFSGDTRRMHLGDAQILEYVLASRPWLEQYRPAILASIAARRAAAADLAFDSRDFVAVRDIQKRVKARDLTLRRQLKGLISRLPSPVARWVADAAG
jgi:glycosyltransferase involved in cell wall biosynthesis